MKKHFAGFLDFWSMTKGVALGHPVKNKSVGLREAFVVLFRLKLGMLSTTLAVCTSTGLLLHYVLYPLST